MTGHRELFPRILFGAGVAGIVIGMAAMAYALAFLGPRVSSVTEELVQSLTVAENGLSLLERDDGLAETSSEVLDQMSATMRQGATALRSTAGALREVEDPTGLIIPGESLEASASELEATASEVDLLVERVGALRGDDSSVGLSQVRAVLADLRGQLGDTEQGLSRLPVGQGAVTLTILAGGLYILLGVLALALSGVMERVDRLARLADPMGPRY